MVNDRQWVMTEKEESEAVWNDKSYTLLNDRQCCMTDNGNWHILAYNDEWQTMVNDRQYSMAYNGEWQWWMIDRQWWME